jgi:hypothetical protein
MIYSFTESLQIMNLTQTSTGSSCRVRRAIGGRVMNTGLQNNSTLSL